MNVRLAAAALWGAAVAAVWAQGGVTVRDGVYSSAQAERGKANYSVYCRACHSEDLSGGSDGGDPAPALRTSDFGLKRRDLGNLYGYIRKAMPRDDPGSLTSTMTADIVAYLLQANGFPPGESELPAGQDALSQIRIVRPDGR